MSWILVTLDFPPAFAGGVASWTDDLARALTLAGEAVSVLARASSDTAIHDRALPYPVVRMPGRSWGRWQGAWAAAALAPRLRPGTRVVFATWRLATLAATFSPAFAVAFHGSELTRLGSAPPALRRVARRARALLPVSAFLAGELRRLGVPGEGVSVLPMPLALPARTAPGGSGLVFLGRLTPLKGVDRAVALARALDLPLTIVGEGPAAPGPAPGLRLLGRLDRVRALATLEEAAACVLLPRPDADGSGAEGLGLCLVEAQARGVRAIGCRTGGVPEAAGAGLVLDDPDRPELDGVRAFLADPEAPARARAWVEAHHGGERAVEVLRASMEGDPLRAEVNP